jgi:hypothetical protein
MSSWAALVRKPSDLGYDDGPFTLPALSFHQHVVASRPREGMLFATAASSLVERREARRSSLDERVALTAALVAKDDQPWVLWCDLNAEGDALEAAIPGAVQIAGADSLEEKESRIQAFLAGETRVLVSKPAILGWGLNLQCCARTAFVGLSDSYEQMYQAIRRFWRFGQTRAVEVHVVTSQSDGAVVKNIERKEREAEHMAREMVKHVGASVRANLHAESGKVVAYDRQTTSGDGWTMHLGDCVDVVREMASESIDYSIFSPPFASLYTYSASDRDMGNCSGREAFMEHFAFLVGDLLRVTKPGRLLSFHCMLLPTSKMHDGMIGLADFRGDLIRCFVAAGWIHHSEVVIWKDPVTAMQRTKALGLLYKQLRKDSAMSRQGIPDYLITMRKPGVNADPVTKTHESFPVDRWQRYASPVWMDINPSDTLQRESAREEKDEKHICPLQLGVIRRAVELWTNPGDLVLSPFAGIGSEGYQALKMGRRFVGVELKRSYWEQACRNLAIAAKGDGQTELFIAPKARVRCERCNWSPPAVPTLAQWALHDREYCGKLAPDEQAVVEE